MIATARVQPAEPPRTFTGKQLTVNPFAGSASRLCSFSIMAVADLAAGLVPFPDQAGVVGGEISFLGMDERRVPAPAVDAGDADATLEQVQGSLAAHAATLGDVIGAAISRAGTGVQQDDVEGRQRVPDARELGFDVARGRDVAVGEMAEVELDAGCETPLQRHLVDGDGAFSVVHRGGEMPGGVEVRGAVGRELDPFDRPAFIIGQVFLLQSGEELDDVGRRLPVGEIVDLGSIARRIGGDVVLQRHRDVDQLAWHEQLSLMRGRISFRKTGVHFSGKCSNASSSDMPARTTSHAGLLGCAVEDQ